MKRFIIVMVFCLIPSLCYGAQLTITIPDAIAQDVLDTYTAERGMPEGGTNPQKIQFMKSKLLEDIKDVYIERKLRQNHILNDDIVRQEADDIMSGVN